MAYCGKIYDITLTSVQPYPKHKNFGRTGLEEKCQHSLMPSTHNMQNVKKDQYSIISTQHTDDLKPAMPGSVPQYG